MLEAPEGSGAPGSSSTSPFGTVALLGLGVMGGSLAKALRANAPETKIVGWSPALGERDDALGSGVVDAAPSAWEEAVEEASLVVLAMPLAACVGFLPTLDGVAPERATLMDVASLKAPVEQVVEQLELEARWVGAHPMAGSEGAGFAHSSAELLEGARVWLVAHERAADRARRVAEFWRMVGADPAPIGAVEHDRRMALVSHLPQLVANALGVEMARRDVAVDGLGPGGRDMTRLAASNVGMWLDLFPYASPDLAAGLRGVAATTSELADALESGDLDAVGRIMHESVAWRAGA
jgi:prephenate dehydrogenase